MSKEYIGTDCYNRKMELYHISAMKFIVTTSKTELSLRQTA